jgi:hypothetical protein
MALTESERQFFTDGLAAFMAAHFLRNQVTRAQFEEAISGLFGVIPDSIIETAPLSTESARPLHDRLAGRDDALEVIMTDVRTYGLLVRDFSRPDALKFPHKSFFEFIFGNFVAKRLTGRDEQTCRAIKIATGADAEAIIGMPEALAFAGEIIADSFESKQDRTQIMDAFLSRIVLQNRFTRSRLAKRLLLFLVVSRYMTTPGIRMISWLSPVFVIALVGAVVSLMLHHFHSDIPLSKTPKVVEWATLFMTGLSVLILEIALIIAVGKSRPVCLWYFIIQSLGYCERDLTLAYGQRIATALGVMARRVAERDYPKAETVTIASG